MDRKLTAAFFGICCVQLLTSQNFLFHPHIFGANLFAGGIDQPRYQFVDIDGDNDPDLFLLDKDEFLWFYRNDLGILLLEPNSSFGLTIGSWMKFVDIDHDGDMDCMTNGSFSEVSLYTNIGSVISPQFQLTTPALLDTSGLELFSERFSIPTFADIDGDGDDDFFSGGSIGSVSYYKNIGTPTAPQFTFITGAFGGINIQGGPAPLPKALHGASGIEFFDADSNGVLDLFWGDYFNPSLYFLYNSGTKQNANIALVDSSYPNEAVVNTIGFNIPQHIDFDSDGNVDLMIGSVFPTAEIDNLFFYKNVGSNTQPFYALQTKNVIPMIDAGSRSGAAAADFDNDGDIDLIVSSAIGTINIYPNTGTAQSPVYSPTPATSFMIDNNFYAMVSAGDINNDGKPDLLVGNFDGSLKTFANTTTNNRISFTQISHVLDGFKVTQNSAPSIADIDNDGDFDVLVGNSGGHVMVLKNNGTNIAPLFVIDSTLNFIDVGNDAVPHVSDIDHDGLLDLFIGNNSGTIFHFEQSGSAKITFELVTSHFEGIDLKTQSAPYLSDLDGDGDLDLLLGNGKGGLFFYENTGASAVSNDIPTVPTETTLHQNFPNPFNPSTTLSFSLSGEAYVSLMIFDLLGRNVETLISVNLKSGKYSLVWNATHHPSGAYCYRFFAQYADHAETITRRMLFIK